jgi:transcriptional regulator with PAS, ATPase and Fis domain
MQEPTSAPQAAAGGHAHLSTRVLALARLGLMVLDANQRIVMWNQWLSSHSGMSAHRVLGSGLFELFPELRGQRLEQAVQSAMQSKQPQQLSPALNRSPFPLYPDGSWGGARIEQACPSHPSPKARNAVHDRDQRHQRHRRPRAPLARRTPNRCARNRMSTA